MIFCICNFLYHEYRVDNVLYIHRHLDGKPHKIRWKKITLHLIDHIVSRSIRSSAFANLYINTCLTIVPSID